MALVKFEKRIAFEVRREGLQIVNCDIYRGAGGRYGFLRLTNYGKIQARSAVFVIRTYDADRNPLNKFAVKLTGLDLEKHASVDYDFPIPLEDDVAGFNFALTSLNGSSNFERPAGKAPFEVRDVQSTIEMVDPNENVIQMKSSDGEEPAYAPAKEEGRGEETISTHDTSSDTRPDAPTISEENRASVGVDDEEDDGGDTFESEGEDDTGTHEEQLSARGAKLRTLAMTATHRKPAFQPVKLILIGAACVGVIAAVVLAIIGPNIFWSIYHPHP